jgi:hypothetical protein
MDLSLPVAAPLITFLAEVGFLSSHKWMCRVLFVALSFFLFLCSFQATLKLEIIKVIVDKVGVAEAAT